MRFSPKGNIFLGYNGQGKTNLLEALSYIQNGRSFKNAADKQLIRFNHPAFELNGTIIERIDIADEDSLQKTTETIEIFLKYISLNFHHSFYWTYFLLRQHFYTEEFPPGNE